MGEDKITYIHGIVETLNTMQWLPYWMYTGRTEDDFWTSFISLWPGILSSVVKNRGSIGREDKRS